MGRRKYSDGEAELLQRLKHENQKLKREKQALRKQLDRLDVDRFNNLKELLDSHDRADREEVDKNNWECWTCRQGILRLAVIERRDKVIYNRVCDHCGHKTKFKDFNDKVKK